MEWQLALLLIFGSLIFLMATGMPVAFSFLLVNLIGVVVFWGAGRGLDQFILSVYDSVTVFTLLPLVLFILMGEVLFHSGIAPLMIDALDKLLWRLPGRLGLLAVAAGTLLATLTGASFASVAILGSTLVPEMEKRGYKKSMSLGPILGSGGLAIMIPPSGLAILIASISQFSIGKMLVAIVVPGFLMAVFYATYIILRCKFQPSIAPPYEVSHIPLSVKLVATVRYILPVGFIVFMVIGVIFLGVATPTEAAATGALGTFILAFIYRKLNWEMVKKSIGSGLEVTVMIFLILVGSKAFGQILAYSGVTRGLTEFVVALPLVPILIIIAMQVVLLIMGTFMSIAAIIVIMTPVFLPIVLNFGFDPIWFAAIFLLNMEVATTSPPFGLSLFVMKGVAPPGTRMEEVYTASLPFIGLDLIVIALMIAFPGIVLWLPGLMRG